MKILGILDNSRPKGNTEILLDIALDKARNQGEETSKICLRDLTIGPCDGCIACFSTGEGCPRVRTVTAF
jgi:multimeric flavodoxin WrbA